MPKMGLLNPMTLEHHLPKMAFESCHYIAILPQGDSGTIIVPGMVYGLQIFNPREGGLI